MVTAGKKADVLSLTFLQFSVGQKAATSYEFQNPFIGGIFLSHHFTQIHTLINPDGLNIREETF